MAKILVGIIILLLVAAGAAVALRLRAGRDAVQLLELRHRKPGGVGDAAKRVAAFPAIFLCCALVFRHCRRDRLRLPL